jgi:hypothetical protein
MAPSKSATKSTKDKAKWVANATYPERPRRTEYRLAKALDFAINTGWATFITGGHGSGKSSATKAHALARGIRPVVLALPTMEPSNLFLPIPKRVKEGDRVQWMLEMALHSKLTQLHPGEQWMLIFDDARRAPQSMMPALFEISNERTLTGLKLDGLVTVVLIDNPVGDGYQGVNSGDIAFESRFAHFDVTANDIAWREHLAAKFPATDLSPIFDAWAKKWDEPMRRVMCARVIDHVCEITEADLPPILGLPLLPSGRQRVVDAGGNDRTKEILQLFASTFGVAYRERIPDQLWTSLTTAVANNWNVHLVGGQGVAKTATIKDLPNHFEGLDLSLFSAANMSMGDLVAQVPADGEVVSIVNRRLSTTAGRKLLVAFDEGFRAPKNVKPQMLEVIQERTIGGEPLGGDGEVVGCWMINNPAKIGNLRFNVGTADEALCSRFTLNIEVTDEDTKWREWLQDRYGVEEVKPFLEWRAHSLKDEERAMVSPRTLHLMIDVFNDLGADELEVALPKLGKERIPVRLHELKARLAKKKVFGPTELFAEIDDIEAKLLDAGLDEVARKDLEDAVIRVLRNADLGPELQPHEAECVRLVKALPSDLRISLIRTENPERQTFWSKVFGQTLV